MRLKLHIWRQAGPNARAGLSYDLDDVSPDMSFLEMLDVLNEQLIEKGEDPIEFEHDCREGICGSCGLMINGEAHGPKAATTTCQLHMRTFKDGDEIYIEPWRAKAFPVIKDLVVDRTLVRPHPQGRLRLGQRGLTARRQRDPDPQGEADEAFDYAACIGCGACVAQCKNASAMLFVGAKVAHLATLPQGKAERERRVRAMVEQMDQEGFGACSNQYECGRLPQGDQHPRDHEAQPRVRRGTVVGALTR
jgi:succinate dehydrogenase / fumarate reductase iron-sulfur subunit